jgi:hypothetical protein
VLDGQLGVVKLLLDLEKTVRRIDRQGSRGGIGFNGQNPRTEGGTDESNQKISVQPGIHNSPRSLSGGFADVKHVAG